jgi:WD40 repeat protein
MVILYFDKNTNFTRGQVGYVSYPEGKFEPITNDTNNYNTLSLSGDGRTLTAIQSQTVGELDMLPAAGGSAGPAIPGLAKQLQQTRDVAWLSDSELLLIQPGRILRLSSEGAKQSELFSDSAVSLGTAAVCGGGHSIVITMGGREGNDALRVWRMDADGANLKRLTDGESDFFPRCSPQGKWVFYYDGKADHWARVPLEGGTPEVLPAIGVPGSPIFAIGSISRDDRMLAVYGTVIDKATSTYKNSIAIVNTASLNAPPVVLPADPRITSGVQFTPDGQAIVYAISGENNVGNLWLQPLDGKPGRQLTNFPAEQIFSFGWSPDGKKLLVGRGHVESDVVLLRDTSK